MEETCLEKEARSPPPPREGVSCYFYHPAVDAFLMG
jgi:hypothetical protein